MGRFAAERKGRKGKGRSGMQKGQEWKRIRKFIQNHHCLRLHFHLKMNKKFDGRATPGCAGGTLSTPETSSRSGHGMDIFSDSLVAVWEAKARRMEVKSKQLAMGSRQ